MIELVTVVVDPDPPPAMADAKAALVAAVLPSIVESVMVTGPPTPNPPNALPPPVLVA
jgi:hypothetical protein